MNTLTKSLETLRAEILNFDKYTNQLYEPLGVIYTSLRDIPDTVDCVVELNALSREVVEIADNIQSTINLTWGKIETLMGYAATATQEEANVLVVQYVTEIVEIVDNTKSLSVKVNVLKTIAAKMYSAAFQMRSNLFGGA